MPLNKETKPKNERIENAPSANFLSAHYKQVVCRRRAKIKKMVNLMMLVSKMTIAICLYSSMVEPGDNVSPVQIREAEEVKNRFLTLLWDNPTRHPTNTPIL